MLTTLEMRTELEKHQRCERKCRRWTSGGCKRAFSACQIRSLATSGLTSSSPSSFVKKKQPQTTRPTTIPDIMTTPSVLRTSESGEQSKGREGGGGVGVFFSRRYLETAASEERQTIYMRAVIASLSRNLYLPLLSPPVSPLRIPPDSLSPLARGDEPPHLAARDDGGARLYPAHAGAVDDGHAHEPVLAPFGTPRVLHYPMLRASVFRDAT